MNTLFKKERLTYLLAAIGVITFTLSPIQAKYTTSLGLATAPTTTSDDVVKAWKQTAVAALPAGPPFPSARLLTIVQLSVFEAVNSITGKYEPFLGTVTSPPDASAEAAAAQASYRAMKLLGIGGSLSPSLDERLAATLSTIPDGQGKTDGIAAGEAAAAAIVASRSNDGSAAKFYVPASAEPGEWQPYAGCPSIDHDGNPDTPTVSAGVMYHFATTLQPFAMVSRDQFRVKPPPALSSDLYARDLNEVQFWGGANLAATDPDKANLARIYQLAPVWFQALDQIGAARQDEITDTARTLAVVFMAQTDGYIAVFDSKYAYSTWRPIHAIPRADEDGNPLTNASAFTALLTTPCFPSYPSAHGTGSGAIVEVLERAYGRKGYNIEFSLPGLTSLYYSDLEDVVNDITDARIWAGFHFRFEQVAADLQGKAVGRYVDMTKLRRIPHGSR